MRKVCSTYVSIVAGLVLFLFPSGTLYSNRILNSPTLIKNQLQTSSPAHLQSGQHIGAADTSSENAVKEYAIQVGAFAKKENAERLKKRIQTAGYRVDIYENLLDGQRLLYLVWVGVYLSEESAQPDVAVIKSKFKIDGVIRPRTVARR